MSQRRNLNTPGHAHELTFSCYKQYRFLDRDRTRQWLADAINQSCKELHYQLWAYVFMPEHVHLIVNPLNAEYDISVFRRKIKEPVGRQAVRYLEENHPEWLPRITRQRGKRAERCFWQPGGGYDRNIGEVETLRKMIDYIHANPVRRGLVDRPEAWEWSSAAWYLSGEAGPCAVHPLGSALG